MLPSSQPATMPATQALNNTECHCLDAAASCASHPSHLHGPVEVLAPVSLSLLLSLLSSCQQVEFILLSFSLKGSTVLQAGLGLSRGPRGGRGHIGAHAAPARGGGGEGGDEVVDGVWCRCLCSCTQSALVDCLLTTAALPGLSTREIG